ncbi:hypothetical protein DIS09_35950 [Burkholderia pseudomallei]|nr:hypothetical protein DIS09_35950 [Burkholderia pseudomallei]
MSHWSRATSHGSLAVRVGVGYRLSVIGYRLSVVGCRLSVVACRLSFAAFSFAFMQFCSFVVVSSSAVIRLLSIVVGDR